MCTLKVCVVIVVDKLSDAVLCELCCFNKLRRAGVRVVMDASAGSPEPSGALPCGWGLNYTSLPPTQYESLNPLVVFNYRHLS